MVNVELYGGLPKVSEKVSVRRMGLVRAARRASCLPSHLVGRNSVAGFLPICITIKLVRNVETCFVEKF